MTHTRPPAPPAGRYGTAPAWRRHVLVALLAALIVAFGTWVAWATWLHGSPQVTSELTAYDVIDDHTVEARVVVSVDDGVEATCRLRAMATDHVSVGEVAFTPTDGANTVVIRTERRATSVEKLGCTTPEQNRPR